MLLLLLLHHSLEESCVFNQKCLKSIVVFLSATSGSIISYSFFSSDYFSIMFAVLIYVLFQIKASFRINHFQVKYFDEDNEEVRMCISYHFILV